MDKLINLTSDELFQLVQNALRKEFFGESWNEAEDYWRLWVWRVMPFGSSVIYAQDSTAFQRSFQIDDSTLEITLNDDKTEVQSQEIWVPVQMTFSAASNYEDIDDGDDVIKTWKLWEGGAYPERNQFYSDSQVSAIALKTPKGTSDKAGARLKLEHYESIPLWDQLWTDVRHGIVKCWAVGKEIFGQVRIPKWLDQAYTTNGWKYKVSVGLTPARDAIEELSLCMFPRVEDAGGFTAVLESAFTAFSKTDPPKPGPSPTQKPPTFGNPNQTMNKEALKMLFSKLTESNPDLLKECGLSADQLDKVEFTTPKEALPPQFATMQAGFVTSKAESFFNEHAAIDAQGNVHATAAMKDPIMGLYRAALQADGENGEIKFSAATGTPEEGDNVKALRNLLNEFSFSTKQGIRAFSAKPGEEGKDPLAVTKESVAADLGVKI